MRRKYWPVLMLALVALAALGYYLHASRDGILLIDDSLRYLTGAENLAAGKGYVRGTGDGGTKPIVGFPPGYSMLLSPWIAAGFDRLVAAKFLGGLLFFANVFLTGWLVFRYSRRLWLAVLVSMAFAGRSAVINHHILVVAEPPFIFLSLAAVLLLTDFLENVKWKRLIPLVLVLGFAPLVRYNGINLLPLAILAILVFSRETWRRRIFYSGLTALMSLIPTIIWLIRNMNMSGSTTNRTFAYHPIPLPMVAEYVDEAISWFIPVIFQLDWRPRLSHLAIFLFLVGGCFLYFEYKHLLKVTETKESGWASQILPLYSAGFMITHMAILFLTTSFLDATMAAYSRYMVPVYVYTLVLLACILDRALKRKGIAAVFGGAGIAVWVFLLGFHVQESMIAVDDFRVRNHYASIIKMDEGGGDYIKSLSPDTVLISDDINLVYVLSGRYAFMIPVRIDNYTLRENDDFSDQLDAYYEKMEQGAFLILTNHHIWNDDGRYASAEVLIEGMDMIYSETAIKIFRHPDFDID